jgi:hypothetical protein
MDRAGQAKLHSGIGLTGWGVCLALLTEGCGGRAAADAPWSSHAGGRGSAGNPSVVTTNPVDAGLAGLPGDAGSGLPILPGFDPTECVIAMLGPPIATDESSVLEYQRWSYDAVGQLLIKERSQDGTFQALLGTEYEQFDEQRRLRFLTYGASPTVRWDFLRDDHGNLVFEGFNYPATPDPDAPVPTTFFRDFPKYTHEYGADNQLLATLRWVDGSIVDRIQSYELDEQGRCGIIAVDVEGNGTVDLVKHFEYDDQGRMTRVEATPTQNAASGVYHVVKTLGYDSDGSLVLEEQDGKEPVDFVGPGAPVDGIPDQIVSKTYAADGSAWLEALEYLTDEHVDPYRTRRGFSSGCRQLGAQLPKPATPRGCSFDTPTTTLSRWL